MFSKLLVASSAFLTTEALRVDTMSKTTAGAMIPETCTENLTRLSGAVNRGDYAKHRGDTVKYTDPDFPPNGSSLFWRGHLYDSDMPATYQKKVTGWARPSELAKGPTSLWGSQGVKPAGTNQGLLGDCWFLASAAALAEHPERIKKLFTNKSYSKAGIFEVTFFHLGEPVKEVVDDTIPITEGKDKRYTNFGVKSPVNSRRSNNGAWWQVILEKAYAKYNVNYAQLNGGQPTMALRDMTGMPTHTYDSRKQTDSQFFDIVSDADKREWAMVAGTQRSYQGLVGGHAYSILSAIQLNGGPKILKMRNPWGREKYTGPFSDKSNLWTAAWKAQVGFVEANDGIIHVPIATFKQAFTNYSVCMYQNWHHETARVTGTGKKFYRSLTSPVDQKVVVTLDYQNKRQIPKGCPSKGKLWYNFYIQEAGKPNKPHSVSTQISYGDYTLNAKAGVTYKVMVINWGNTSVDGDFILGAYGDEDAATWAV